jgi:catechol 2,3-dioxygenase-like lactoylglutathione lyase family enzyme
MSKAFARHVRFRLRQNGRRAHILPMAMNAVRLGSLLALFMHCAAPAARAQLTAAKDHAVVFGHIHLQPTSNAEHTKFWIQTLGGTHFDMSPSLPETLSAPYAKFPNFMIHVAREKKPKSGTKGTLLDHVAFQVPSVRAMVAKVRAAGYPIVTTREVGTIYKVRDDIAFNTDLQANVAFTLGPDEVLVEFVEIPGLGVPIAFDHIHLLGSNLDEMRAWYIKMLGPDATLSKHGTYDAIDLPAVPGALTFSRATTPVVTTRGSIIDHIGFEVQDHAAFVKHLQAIGLTIQPGGPAYHAPSGIRFAQIDDPWGVGIEATEGAARK